MVWHRVPGTLAGGLMQPRWQCGIFLGRRLESNEIFVSISDGSVVRARDFKEVPDNMAWDPELVKQLKGTSFDHT